MSQYHSTATELSPMALDCTCWPEGSTGATWGRCAPCVAACVLVDAADEEITGITRAAVADAVDRVAPEDRVGDAVAVLDALLEVAGLEGDGPVYRLLGRRGHYAGQVRRSRAGVRPLPHDDAWTELVAEELLVGVVSDRVAV